MDITKMSRKDFESLPRCEWDKTFDNVRSIIIIPHRRLHDSGYRCMSFVPCDKDNKPICLCGGGSDVLWCTRNEKLLFKSVSIDCLPKSGLLRLFSHGSHFIICSQLSTFAISLEDDETPKSEP